MPEPPARERKSILQLTRAAEAGKPPGQGGETGSARSMQKKDINEGEIKKPRTTVGLAQALGKGSIKNTKKAKVKTELIPRHYKSEYKILHGFWM